MAPSPVRVAILGAGIFAKEAHLPAILKSSELIHLVAVYSRSRSSAVGFADHVKSLNGPSIAVFSDDSADATLPHLLARTEIDAVIIALAINSQPALVKMCIHAGKHVLSEKPVAGDLASAKDLIASVEAMRSGSAGPIWAVAENYRMESAFVAARDLLRSNTVGKPLNVFVRNIGHIAEDNKYQQTTWRQRPDYQGGFIFDSGVHWTALIRLLTGSEASNVKAVATPLAFEHLWPMDNVTGSLRMENGVTASLTISFASPSYAEQSALVICTEGHVSIVRRFIEERGFVIDVKVTDVKGTIKFEKRFDSDGVDEEVRVFAKSIQAGNLDQRLSPTEAMKDLAVIEEMIVSANASA